MNIELRRVPTPAFETFEQQPAISAQEYAQRCDAAYSAAGVEWLVVYADREHAGNVHYFTGFDPRFEEALVVLGPNSSRTLVVGNEGVVYAPIAGLDIDVVLAQSLSLMGQPRAKAPRLDTVFETLGLGGANSVGVVGWKYLEEFEGGHPDVPAFVPAFLLDAIERTAGTAPKDVTQVLMNPVSGLRNIVTAQQIAAWEYAAVESARSIFGIIHATKPGITEFEAVQGMGYKGLPFSAHLMYATGSGAINGLRSPSARVIEDGDGVTTALGYAGGLTCRAGIIASKDEEFFDEVGIPYFRAIATWYSNVGIGVRGGDLWQQIEDALGDAKFRPLVNPGHLIAHEEWTHTPLREGSEDVLVSGMALQCDIIPYPLPAGWALDAEDGVALADAELRAEIAEQFPEMWERIQTRRTFMEEQLGIKMREEVLPLSPTCGYLAPYWLDPELVFTVQN